MKIPDTNADIFAICKALVEEMPPIEAVTITEHPPERVWWLQYRDKKGNPYSVRVITLEDTLTYQVMSGGKEGFRLGRQNTLTEAQLTEFEEQGLLNVIEE